MPLGPTKNQTSWINTRNGAVSNIGTAFIVDNSATPNFIVDQSGNFIVTTPLIFTPNPPASWTPASAS